MASQQITHKNILKDIKNDNTTLTEITNTELFTKKEILKNVVEDDTTL